MKSNSKFSINIIKRLLVCIFVIIALCSLIFGMVACNKNKTDAPTNEQTTPDDGNTPAPDDTPDDSNPALTAFLTALDNISGKNASSWMTVSFGGQLLSRKIIEYTRTISGGIILTTTTSLATANAQEPLTTTTDSPVNLTSDEFESRFPTFTNLLRSIDADRLSLEGNELAIELAKAEAVELLSLNSNDAANIASNVQIVITVQDGAPYSFVATYTSSNGNSVEIKVLYS